MMSSHFLLSAAARTISLRQVYAGGEEKAFEQFKKFRWPETDGKPVCPRCGSFESYDITTRRKHKCKGCGHQFSVTSGTILASRKMAFVDLLAAIVILSNAVKGVPCSNFPATSTANTRRPSFSLTSSAKPSPLKLRGQPFPALSRSMAAMSAASFVPKTQRRPH